MRLLKVYWLVFLVAIATSFSSQAEENPYELLEQAASKTFDIIKAKQPEIESDPELLKQIVERELLPYVDYRFAGAKVLGKHFKSIAKDREKIGEYFEEFRKYLIVTYAGALSQYEDQEVEFEPARDFTGKKTVTVRAVIKDEGKPDIKLAFKVRKNRNTNKWLVYDMVAEGISVLSSKSSEFESILRQEGVDKVIAIMRDVNNKSVKDSEQEQDA